MKKKVIIASKNPVKIESVEIGCNKVFTGVGFDCEGVSVPSNVSDQPMSDEETFNGAMNRAVNAKALFPKADFWVGIEGGIEKRDDEMMAFAWIVIASGEITGKARTGTFFLPPQVVQLIEEGMELGDADDVVFGQSNSKQKNGAVGLLTKNIIDRSKFYQEAVVLALIPFLNKNIY